MYSIYRTKAAMQFKFLPAVIQKTEKSQYVKETGCIFIAGSDTPNPNVEKAFIWENALNFKIGPEDLPLWYNAFDALRDQKALKVIKGVKNADDVANLVPSISMNILHDPKKGGKEGAIKTLTIAPGSVYKGTPTYFINLQQKDGKKIGVSVTIGELMMLDDFVRACFPLMVGALAA